MSTFVDNWFDVTDYGATGNRTTDDAPAIGSAITACINGGGGTVYFPGGTNGHYLINEPIVVSTTVPVSFLGDNVKGTWNDAPGASAICCNFAPTAATGNYYAVAFTAPTGSTAPACNMTNMLVLADATNTFGSAVDYTAIYTNTLWDCTLTNVSVGQGTGGQFNTAVQFKNMLSGLLENCNTLFGEQQALWMNGGAGVEISDSGVSSGTGNNYGNIRMDNNAGTLRIRNCVSVRGDRGLYVPSGSTSPFIFIYDYEINNPALEGIGLYSGSQFWADQLWFTQAGESSSTVRTNINFGPNYTGNASISNSALGSSTGHNVWIQGGSGYTFTGCSFGAASFAATNTYDCINIGNSVSSVSLANCHFGVDALNGVGDARAAVYTNGSTSGPVVLSGNMFAPTGWGTAPVIDYANQVVAHGNSGWKHEVQTTTNSYTCTTSGSWVNVTPSYAVNPYEATVGDVYRLVMWGDGTMASGTPVNLDVQGNWGGNSVGYSVLTGTPIGAGNGFHWKCEIDFTVISSSLVSPSLRFSWGQSANSTTSNQNLATSDNSSGVSFNSNTGTNAYLQMQWSSATGSPTITCRGSYLQCVTL